MALLFNRKNKDDKKGRETNIGKGIYILLLFAPIFAIAVTCLYAIFNDNARDSFSGQVSYKETGTLESTNNIVAGRNYYTYETVGNYSTTNYYNVTNLVLTKNNEIIFTTQNYNYSYYLFTTSGQQLKISGQSTMKTVDNTVEETLLETIPTRTDGINDKKISQLIFGSTYVGANVTGVYLPTILLFDTYYINTKLNDVFYYGVDSAEKSELFNWSKNTGTYTVIQNVTTTIGITNEFTPMLLSYWLLVSVTYFVYDIALILIWAVHKKIHLLMESI